MTIGVIKGVETSTIYPIKLGDVAAAFSHTQHCEESSSTALEDPLWPSERPLKYTNTWRPKRRLEKIAEYIHINVA